MKRPPIALVPPVQVIIWGAAGYAIDRLVGTPPCLPPAISLAGWLPVIGGFGLILWSIAAFHRAGTSEKPWIKPRSFVERGPFRFTRNPMYTGMALILTGAAIIKGSAIMLLAPAGFMTTVTLTWIRYEEWLLAKTFGRSYRNYRSRVSRWL